MWRRCALTIHKRQMGSVNYIEMHQHLKAAYQQIREQAETAQTASFMPRLPLHDEREVFCNNETNLDKIKAYGFDYDYTLAGYTKELSRTIYALLRDIMVHHMRYPAQLCDKQYDPTFAIRGLHYDVQTGWLMKLDAYNNIQMDTVHYGREALVDADKVFQIHGGIHIAPTYIRENMKHLNDFFSLPNACLLADIIQYFDEHNIRFHPRHLVDDLNAAAEYIHSGSAATGQLGLLHQTVLKNIDKYLNASPKTTAYLEKLRRHGKKTFLVTNSGFEFIDKGLAYILGTNEWRSLFDVVIVDSNKPLFYSGRRPFRRIATRFSSTHEPGWQFVDGFQQDEVYQGGNLRDFSAFTGWFGTKSSVIYFGDSIYSDLSEPAALQGWRTACVVLIS